MDNCVKQLLWAEDVFEKERSSRLLFIVFTWVEMSLYNMIFSFLANKQTISGNWANALHFMLFLWLVARCFYLVFVGYFALQFRSSQLVLFLVQWLSIGGCTQKIGIGLELAVHSYDDTLFEFFIVFSTWRLQIRKSKTKEPPKCLCSSGTRGTEFISVHDFPVQ